MQQWINEYDGRAEKLWQYVLTHGNRKADYYA